MQAAISHAPEKNNVDYSGTKIKKPVLVKSIQPSKAAAINKIVTTETQPYTFVGIAG